MSESDFNGLDLMVSLSWFGGLTVRPWAASFFSSLLDVKVGVHSGSPQLPPGR
jgi:hypothetical protein